MTMLRFRKDGDKDSTFVVSDGNPLPVSPGQIRAVQASFAAEAAGNYADNDVVSNHVSNGTGTALEFTNAVRGTGMAGKVIGASIASNCDTLLATTELQLFAQTPTATELDDNAAEGGVGAADLPYYIGLIAFAALADIGAGSYAVSSAPTPAAPLLIRATATSIFGRLIFRDAETNEAAGMIITITLYVE